MAGETVRRLDVLADVVATLKEYPQLSPHIRGTMSVQAGALHCTRCGGDRKMTIKVRQIPHQPTHLTPPADTPKGALLYTPALISYACVQCSAAFTAVIYPHVGGAALAVLPSDFAGAATPHTPEAVAYYLDQAHRAHSLGANSAAVAMFRAALEQLLHDQGFMGMMLAKKITDLETAIAASTAPQWARDLDTEWLKIIKNLGNGAIHANGGDITKQSALDATVVRQLTALFTMLLFTIYEHPAILATQKAALLAAAGVVK